MPTPAAAAAPALAQRFVALLRAELTDAQWREMRRRNATIPPGACASHDFCDANQVLLNAAEALGINVWDAADEHFSDEGIALMNAAWSIAEPSLGHPARTSTTQQ